MILIFPNSKPSLNWHTSTDQQVEIKFIMAENKEQNIENKAQDHVEENCDQIAYLIEQTSYFLKLETKECN